MQEFSRIFTAPQTPKTKEKSPSASRPKGFFALRNKGELIFLTNILSIFSPFCDLRGLSQIRLDQLVKDLTGGFPGFLHCAAEAVAGTCLDDRLYKL